MSKNVNNLKELERVLVDSLDRDILYNFTINNYSLEFFLVTLEEEEKVYRVRVINNLYNTYNILDFSSLEELENYFLERFY